MGGGPSKPQPQQQAKATTKKEVLTQQSQLKRSQANLINKKDILIEATEQYKINSKMKLNKMGQQRNGLETQINEIDIQSKQMNLQLNSINKNRRNNKMAPNKNNSNN